MTNAKRISCCVPGCRRTIGKLDNSNHIEWICDKHYKLVDKRLKDLRQKFNRRDLALAKVRFKSGKDALRWTRFNETDKKIWRRMKAQAIERAVGIG